MYWNKASSFCLLIAILVYLLALQPGFIYSHRSFAYMYCHSVNFRLSRLHFKPHTTGVITVNHNRSTLNPKSWHFNHIVYRNLDYLHRASKGNVAYLEQRNVTDDSQRILQTYRPVGWYQRIYTGQPLLNRGHEIAYSLSKGIDRHGRYCSGSMSGDQNNPRNLFTQTAFSNQELQTIYEQKVKNALLAGKHVVYSVTPVFRGLDKVPVGVHLQAVSTDRTLNFNVYIFNVQPKVRFDYRTGLNYDNKRVILKRFHKRRYAYSYHNDDGETITPRYMHHKREFGVWKLRRKYRSLKHKYATKRNQYRFIKHKLNYLEHHKF